MDNSALNNVISLSEAKKKKEKFSRDECSSEESEECDSEECCGESFNVDKKSFRKREKIMSSLKGKASIGRVGNASIGRIRSAAIDHIENASVDRVGSAFVGGGFGHNYSGNFHAYSGGLNEMGIFNSSGNFDEEEIVCFIYISF
jgi:hypothetical protein